MIRKIVFVVAGFLFGISLLSVIGNTDALHSDKHERSAEEIQNVFTTHAMEIWDFYSGQLNRNPDIEGDVFLKISVDSSGTVEKCVIVSSTINDSAFENGLVKKVLGFTFGESDAGEATFTYPLHFQKTK